MYIRIRDFSKCINRSGVNSVYIVSAMMVAMCRYDIRKVHGKHKGRKDEFCDISLSL
jgi:hypothetical protein